MPTSLPLSSEVVAEITRLNPAQVYVVGDATSSWALNASVYAALQAAFPGKVQPRIAGADSYGTSAAVAAKVRELRGNTTGGTVFLARGDGDSNFADALSASSPAARLKAPIILTTPATLSAIASSTVSSLEPSSIVVCGGTGAVASSTADAAAAAAGITTGYERLGGLTRFHTAALIADWGVARFGPPSIVYVANGMNYPDALGGGVLAGIGHAAWQPVLLTMPASLTQYPQTQTFIQGHATVDHATILGGTGTVAAPVVNANVENSLYNLFP
jgi:putative cell wall-binding protein